MRNQSVQHCLRAAINFTRFAKPIICNSIELPRFTFQRARFTSDLRVLTVSRDRKPYFLPRLLKKCGRRSRVMVLNKRDIKRGATPSISSRRSSFYNFSDERGAGSEVKTETKLKSRRCRDGNREIALPTLIFKNAKLQEARGQIDPPRRRSAGHGEPAGGTTAKEDAPVHLRPTRPTTVDLADRRMRHFRKPFASNFRCNKIPPALRQFDPFWGKKNLCFILCENILEFLWK